MCVYVRRGFGWVVSFFSSRVCIDIFSRIYLLMSLYPAIIWDTYNTSLNQGKLNL